ncbi:MULTISPECIES: CcdB family protein [unclassified Sphingomonas]|uniref:CcdB family protein n=1 Tax=unclassified Sphingomonas TaxID=196159 RepID=UPI000ADD9A2A|nr:MULTISPECIES: CcdB family protein [unclassified Sphingomonas]
MLLDCQSDLLSHLATRFVVPLLPVNALSPPVRRLNPEFRVEDATVVMYTQLAAAVPVRELGDRVASLADEQDRIVAAIDFLLSGF